MHDYYFVSLFNDRAGRWWFAIAFLDDSRQQRMRDAWTRIGESEYPRVA